MIRIEYAPGRARDEGRLSEAAVTKAEDAKLRAGGMKVIELKGEGRKKYLAAAFEIPWKRLKSRDATHYDALRAKFFKAE